MDQANILIIGGGVIGCAIANTVSKRWQDVFLVEQFPKLGMATSTRNSGVNHSGIYYPKNSLKARLCVEGNRLTYEFCKKHNVPFRHCGKLVVAVDAHERSEEHTSELQSLTNLVCRLLLEKKKKQRTRAARTSIRYRK